MTCPAFKDADAENTIISGSVKFKITTAMNTSTPAKYSELKTDLSTNISVPFKNLTFDH